MDPIGRGKFLTYSRVSTLSHSGQAPCHCSGLVSAGCAPGIRLAQVFVNLLNNAAKYTKRGGHIWLTAERQGSDAVVSVRDNGIGLPKLNGYDVARRIRQQPWGRDVILVAVTGWGQDEDRRRSLEAGFNFHAVKPMKWRLLKKYWLGTCKRRTADESNNVQSPSVNQTV